VRPLIAVVGSAEPTRTYDPPLRHPELVAPARPPRCSSPRVAVPSRTWLGCGTEHSRWSASWPRCAASELAALDVPMGSLARVSAPATR